MTNQQLATKSKADTVRAALEKLKPQMAMALPRHITPDRLLRVTMSAVQQAPKLLDCDRTSLFAAVMTCAQLGLEPDGVLGQAYLVPFKGKVQFIPGYRGLLSLARNSGDISSIQAHEVREHDEFEYAYGLDEKLHHVPAEGDRGEITHFYAYAKFKDGGYIFEVLTLAQVEKVRDSSEGYKAFKSGAIKSNPWDSHFVEMGRKTAIRRIAKFLPLSVQRAAAFEDAMDRGAHAKTDDYGDVVIEGEGHEVTNGEEQDGNGAAAKLNALAGEDSPEETNPEPEKKPAAKVNGSKDVKKRQPRKTNDVEVPKQGSTGENFEAKKPANGRYKVEDGEVVDSSTGEIVPEELVAWHEDGTFSIQQGKEPAGLFGEEG
jgi:recombination protein RecT